MNPAELRINNLVKDSGGKTLRIDWFERGKVCQRMMIDGKEVHPLTEDFEYLKPIPLTAEWLERLGFKHNSLGDYIKIKDRLFWVDNANKKKWWLTEEKTGKTIDLTGTVHNLQNTIFELTDEELTIKEKAA